tara:strand:+ start:1406 stop:1822 length:417 start_codon:yes stop_codon:yes gene_type:complete
MEPNHFYYNKNKDNTINYDDQNFNNNKYNTLFVIILIFIFFGKLWWHVQLERWNNNDNNLNQRLINNSPTYDPNIIEKKEIKYNHELHHDKECTICLEEYQENDELYQLQCDHYYHKECINDWLLKHQTCPLCRLNLV